MDQDDTRLQTRFGADWVGRSLCERGAVTDRWSIFYEDPEFRAVEIALLDALAVNVSASVVSRGRAILDR
jgi:hypothetical protein